MCGRYFIAPEVVDLLAILGIDDDLVDGEAPDAWNIAPTEPVLAARVRDGRRELAWHRWGMIPIWWKKDKPPGFTINARDDKVATNGLWKGAFRKGRCVIPMSGWYEWQKPDKVPFAIGAPDAGYLFAAGLWSPRSPTASGSAAIITTAAADGVAHVHDRMPVLLRRDQIETWLAEDTPVDDLQAMLQPWPHELAVVQVDKAVGNVRHKDGAWMAGPWLEMPEDVSPT